MTPRGLPLRGRALRDLRLDRNLKQDKAAELLGVSLKTLGNWEASGRELGGQAEPANIAKLAQFYDVAQEDIIADGHAPREPMRTTEEALAEIQQELLRLGNDVRHLALDVDALARHAGVKRGTRGE